MLLNSHLEVKHENILLVTVWAVLLEKPSRRLFDRGGFKSGISKREIDRIKVETV